MNSSKGQPNDVVLLMDELSRFASGPHSLEATSDQFSSALKKLIPVRRKVIYLLNEEEAYQPLGTDATGEPGFDWVDQLIEDGIIDWFIQEEKVSSIPDPTDAKKGKERLIIPLIVRGKGLGFAAVEGRFGRDGLTEAKRDLLARLASIVGMALENQILTEKVEERLHRLDVLERISQKLLLIADLNQLLEFILDYALEVVPSQEAALAWSDDGVEALIVKNRERGGERSRSHLTQIEKWVVEKGHPLILNDYTHDIRFREDQNALPFPLRHILSTPIALRDRAPGALTLFNHQESQGYSKQDFFFLSTLASHAAVAIEIATLYRNMKQAYKETIRALVNAIEAKDPYTRGHTERVTDYALQLADAIGISPNEREILEYASLLHDVGKIGVSEKILRKKGSLSEPEYRQIKEHPVIGEAIVKDVRFLDRARCLIRNHHERYDGRGYPDSLDGESVSLPGHILVLADALDAMSSNRSYRNALSREAIRKEILKNAGKQFHPQVVNQTMKLFFSRAVGGSSGNRVRFSGKKKEKGVPS
jgi:GAF domain-containing protein